MKVSLDTNVLVSAFGTRGLCADILHVVLAEHELIIGEAVLTETRRVLTTKFGVPTATVDEVDALLRQQSRVVTNAPRVGMRLRDADDVLILSEAVAGGAEVLVTGDRDLLAVAGKAPLAIVTPRGFWEMVRGGG
ncbi:MAG: putative toxin-antitoxin system toxin component, PIN family [Gemmatimonadetes bacterium]|nr:putative toxin-antitoxin system toxin component, PIN family [Gemmatimonadota bacterium]MCA9769394.1 putative toxin-antitoxin system toxin component, PIN family [Gemmatimonadota bacterium]